MEVIEKRGNGPRPWRIRYKDNPGDPITAIGGFVSKAEALAWLAANPAVEVDDDGDQE